MVVDTEALESVSTSVDKLKSVDFAGLKVESVVRLAVDEIVIRVGEVGWCWWSLQNAFNVLEVLTMEIIGLHALLDARLANNHAGNNLQEVRDPGLCRREHL